MKNKISSPIVFLLFWTVLGSAQQQVLENYTQEIPGSELVIEMVAIPGGTFIMGSPETEENRFEDEGPVHEVNIEPFWMSKYEITWACITCFYIVP